MEGTWARSHSSPGAQLGSKPGVSPLGQPSFPAYVPTEGRVFWRHADPLLQHRDGICTGRMPSILLNTSQNGNSIPGPVLPMPATEPPCGLQVPPGGWVTLLSLLSPTALVLSSGLSSDLAAGGIRLPTEHEALCSAERDSLCPPCKENPSGLDFQVGEDGFQKEGKENTMSVVLFLLIARNLRSAGRSAYHMILSELAMAFPQPEPLHHGHQRTPTSSSLLLSFLCWSCGT